MTKFQTAWRGMADLIDSVVPAHHKYPLWQGDSVQQLEDILARSAVNIMITGKRAGLDVAEGIARVLKEMQDARHSE